MFARNRNIQMQIYEAARDNRIGYLADMLRAGGNPDSRSSIGRTALMEAARRGHVGIIRVLLQAGAKVNIREPYNNRTALMFATSSGHPNAARALIYAGATVNRNVYNNLYNNSMENVIRNAVNRKPYLNFRGKSLTHALMRRETTF